LYFFSSPAFGQRVLQQDLYPPIYFDSIRALVNDTTRENYTINAYRLAETDEIIINGRLDELVWNRAERGGGFLEKEPYPLIPMSEQTEFAILYDDENLYIGVWCWDSEPDKIIRQLSPRGTSTPDNLFIFIDSYHDHRTGYKFTVSPTGVQADELRYDDFKRDDNWNGIWYSAGSVDEHGWYAEIKIPFFNFRFTNKYHQTWGFNIMRNISKDASRGQWKPHLPEWDNTTRMSKNGHIENIYNISSGRTFELRPYGVAGTTNTLDAGSSRTFSFGGDLRYSPTPSLTADFTLNPDFAQVDADVFEINLTRFPTRFRELRPFFTERTNIFNTPMELFYSRRIGARGDIIGGVKTTGKISHGIEFGMLANLTGESFFSSSTLHSESARFGVFRVKKDLMGSSNIGVLAATKEEPGRFNRVIGVDGNFIYKTHNLLEFQIASGLTEMGYDQNMAYQLALIRTGDLFGAQIDFERVEPAFEINRIGYLQKEIDRGWNKGSGLVRISPRINKYHIRRLISNLKIEHNVDIFTSRYINRWLAAYPDFIPDELFGEVGPIENGERVIDGGIRSAENYAAGGDLTVNLINEMSITSEYRRYSATELTGSYTGSFLKMGYSTRPLSMGTQFAGNLSVSAGTLYNFVQKYVGSQRSLTLNGDGRINRNMTTKLQGGYTRTYDNMDVRDGDYLKVSSNSIWMFTKDFYVRLHAQGIFGTTYYEQRKTHNEYLLSGLVSWEYRPGSFLYLAYNESRFDDTNPTRTRYLTLDNRTIVLKVSYLLNI
jgi:hypothetical protein